MPDTVSYRATDDSCSDEDYYLPPQDQRAFGAGIKRKRVTFVPASTPTTEPEQNLPSHSTQSDAGARYLSIVLSQKNSQEEQTPNSQTQPSSTTTQDANPPPSATQPADSGVQSCPICHQPITPSTLKSHASSIAHQLHLEHSHPPSHLDRQRKGLKYLEGYGWDPDARVGLGVRNDGIRVPVQAKEKRDTTGLGLFSQDEDDDRDHAARRRPKTEKRRDGDAKPVARLDAKQVRRMEDEKKKKAEKLRSVFYGDDFSQYLGPEG